MIEGIESLYQIIANSVNEAIPEEWATAQLDVTYYEDGSDYWAEYTRQSDGLARSVLMPDPACRAFDDIRALFKEAGKPVWGQASFQISSDGKFNMKWGYNNCDVNGDTIWDEDEYDRLNEERRLRLTRV